MTMRNIINSISAYLAENDSDHAAALERTGFWGQRGAGCIMVAKDTGRILIAHRASKGVEEPETWGTWGGAVDSSNTFEETVIKEVEEECGYHGSLNLVPIYKFVHTSGFVYQNFIAIIDAEFTPQLNWESQGYEWCEFGDWPHPLHPGLQKVFADSASMNTLEKIITAIVDNLQQNQ